MTKTLTYLAILIGAALLIPRPSAAAVSLGAVAHPFPSSRGKILIFTDQLPSHMTALGFPLTAPAACCTADPRR